MDHVKVAKAETCMKCSRLIADGEAAHLVGGRVWCGDCAMEEKEGGPYASLRTATAWLSGIGNVVAIFGAMGAAVSVMVLLVGIAEAADKGSFDMMVMSLGGLMSGVLMAVGGVLCRVLALGAEALADIAER
jgi:hypothetical protein